MPLTANQGLGTVRLSWGADAHGTARMRTEEHFYSPVFFSPLQPITQGAGAKAPSWKMSGKLEPLKMEPLEVEEAEEGEGNEGLSQPGQ